MRLNRTKIKLQYIPINTSIWTTVLSC